MANVEYRSHVTPQCDVGFRNWNACKFREPRCGFARIQVVGEIVHDFIGCFEKAIWLRLERNTDSASRAVVELHKMSGDAQQMFRKRFDDLGSGHARLESERRGLD